MISWLYLFLSQLICSNFKIISWQKKQYSYFFQLTGSNRQTYIFISKPYNFISKLYNFISKPYNFISKPYNFISKLYNFISKPYNFISKLYNFISKPYNFKMKPYNFISKLYNFKTKLYGCKMKMYVWRFKEVFSNCQTVSLNYSLYIWVKLGIFAGRLDFIKKVTFDIGIQIRNAFKKINHLFFHVLNRLLIMKHKVSFNYLALICKIIEHEI